MNNKKYLLLDDFTNIQISSLIKEKFFSRVFIHISNVEKIKKNFENEQSNIFKSFENDFDLFDELSTLSGVLFVFKTLDWSIPFPLPHVRIITSHLFTTIEKLSKRELGNLTRRSSFILTDERNNEEYKKVFIYSSIRSLAPVASGTLNQITAECYNSYHNIQLSEYPKVNIVTPSYNQGKFIEETIKSVLNQNYPNLTYNIVDGLSKDETLTILKRYEKKVKWVSEKDNGYADAVNKGLLNSNAEFYCWIASDDLLYNPNAILVLVKTALESQADLVYGDACYCDEEGKTVAFYPTEEFDRERFKETCFICQPSTLFRAKVFNKIGGLDTKLKSISDYNLWLNFMDLDSKIERAGVFISKYRLHKQSISVSQRVLTNKEIFEVELKKFGRVGKSWIEGAIHECFNPMSQLRKNNETIHNVIKKNRWSSIIIHNTRLFILNLINKFVFLQFLILVLLKIKIYKSRRRSYAK